VQIQPNANLLILSTSSTGHLPEATADAPYAYGFETNVGEAGVNAVLPITFLPSQTLPPGLTLSSQGVLSGTPTQAGTFDVQLTALDSSPAPRTARATFLLSVRLPGATLTQVAHNDLGGHGQNADIVTAMATATKVPYAYIGTRGYPGECPASGVKIVDLRQITSPQVVATVGGVQGASQQEAKVLTGVSSVAFHGSGQGDLMAVTEQPCDPSNPTAAESGLRFFDVSDPTNPTLLGSWSPGLLGVGDVALLPANGHLYALAAVPGSETSGGEGDLRVLDITDPSQPREIANWGVLTATDTQLPQAVMGQDQRVYLDTIQLSSDKKTAYLGYWDEGVVILDVSDPTAIATNNANIFLDHITYPQTAAATSDTPSSPEGNTHEALPVVNDSELLVADQVCATAQSSGQGNPSQTVAVNPAVGVVCGPKSPVTLDINHGWGFVRTYSLPTPGSATLESFFATPESLSAPAPDLGIYTAHNLAWNGDVSHPHGYVAWFSDGIVDLDLSSIDPPTVLASFVPPDTPDPNGTNSAVNNPAKALVYGVASLKQNGLSYILASDINSGLWIVQETPTSSLTILTTTLPDGNVGVPYLATLSAANGALGSSAVTFSVVSGGNPLPTGLSLDGQGNITGTPLVAGAVAVTFQALDSAGHTTQQTINMTIDQTLAILPPAPPIGTTGEPYSLTLTAANGTSPYTFSVLSPLPTGMAISSTGVISGTPANSGTTTTQIQVTDSSVPPLKATLPITIQVQPLAVKNTVLDPATVGVDYSATVEMVNGAGPFTPILVGGALPPGMALAASAGGDLGWLISGTPTQAGVFPFTVRITDNDGLQVTQALTLVVNPFEITPTVLNSGTEGRGYQATFGAQGGTGPYTFSLVTGSLPAGLSLDASGNLTGVPASGSAGTYTFGVLAKDSTSLSVTTSYQLVIFSGTAFAVTTTGLPPAQAGQTYSQTINADFGTTPYSFQVVSGTVPAGLSLSTNGILSGVPGTGSAGTYTFTVQATDANNRKAAQSLKLTVLPAVSPK